MTGVPIRWRLTATYVVLVAAIVGVLSLVLYGQLEGFVVDDATRRVAADLERITTRDLGPKAPGSQGGAKTPKPKPGGGAAAAGAAAAAVHNDVTKASHNMVRELSGRDTSIVVRWPDGELIEASDPLPDVPGWPASTAEEASRVLSDAALVRRVDAGRDPRALLVVAPVQVADGMVVAVAAVATSLEAGDRTLDQLRLYLLLGLLAAILLGTALGLPITRALLRPLDRVAETARRIGEGDRSVRVGAADDGTEIGRLGVEFDRMVDQLEASAMQLQASATAQRRFVADASHELRTPLTALGGMVEVLLLGIDAGDHAAVQRVLTALRREIGRLSRLAGDLLLLSQLEDGAGRLPLTMSPVQLAGVAHEVTEELAPLTGERNVQESIPDDLVVPGDRDRIKQVLLNLVENAARHTEPNGTIRVLGTRDKGWIRLSVSDDGEGLAPEDPDRIFDRFYRSDEARARSTGSGNSGGSGLGLAIVRAIAEAHGGSAVAHSAGPGLGTTVSVTLPAG